MPHPNRPELEVFVNEIGTITIRQADAPAIEGEPIVVVHPEDVSALMRALERARRETVRAAADDHDEVTVPELYSRWPTGSA